MVNKINIIKNFLTNFNLFLQKHFVGFVLISIILIIIINSIWFSTMDPNENFDNFHFNRTIIKIGEKEINGKTIDIYKFISDPFTDACHYTFTTMSTIGYGDITPKSTPAKYWTMVMHILAIIMSLKIFEYFITDDASSKALLKRINELDNENENLKNKNKELTVLINTKCANIAIQKLKKISSEKKILPINE